MAGQITDEILTGLNWVKCSLAALALLTGSAVTTAHAETPTHKFQSWAVQCPQKNACIAYLEGAGVQILVGRSAPGQPVRMGLRVLPGAKSGQPAALRLSDGWQAGLKIGKCSEKFCEIAVAENSVDKAIGAFLKTKEGVLAYEVGGKILIAPFSLAGFQAALHEVRG